MDLIDPNEVTGLRAARGLTKGKLFLVSGLDPEEVLPGETLPEAYARRGRAPVVDLDGDPARLD